MVIFPRPTPPPLPSIFGIVWRECSWHVVGRPRDGSEHPTVYWTAAPQKVIQPKISLFTVLFIFNENEVDALMSPSIDSSEN